MHSIRLQITTITIVAILTSILSVFAASFQTIKGETDQNSAEMMNLIVQDTQKSLEKYFESIEQSVETAANIAIDNMDSVLLVECGAVRTASDTSVQSSGQIASLDAYLNEYCAKVQESFSGIADYTHGVTAYYYCINPEISRSRHGFYYMKIGKTGFIEQQPIDVQHLVPTESLHATWYEAAVSRGRPVWLGPYNSPSQNDSWICSYFVPIYKAGMLIGLMGMDIPCDTLIEQVKNIHIYDTGFICLMDSEGKVIYHPDYPIGNNLDEIGPEARLELLRNNNSGYKLFRYTVKGEERFLSFSTLPNRMKLACVAPASEINAPWTRLIRTILLITAVVIILYATAVLLLVNFITRPLQALTAASQRLAEADYDVDLSYSGKNEIGALTKTFTLMRDQIKYYIAGLNHQIYHDRLTDLPNMRHFFTLAEQGRRKMIAEGQNPVMLYFNIVGLRYYNRQYGFEKGDILIKDFAKILSEQFGRHRVCRFNGDRFAAVTDEENVDREIREVLQKWEVDENRLPICVGVYPNSLGEVDVNVACDRAKFAGERNKDEHASSVTFFDKAMLNTAEINIHIIHNLDRALEEGWVRVYYQPIIRAADGKICDVEALARWIDPVYGFISPGEFIPALEESKLVHKLDLYVLDRVLEKMKRQTQLGFYPVPHSVNLSRRDFERCDMVEEIHSRVDAAGIDRSMITIEITESVIGKNFEFMKEQVERFRQLGFPVWMDDFGSGYSSLDVLHQIRFDVIKFDMRFMERFDEHGESRIILTELMNMAIGLGIETVCEGVEELEQVEFLREIGCTRIQGYYYGKPLPFDEFIALSAKGEAPEFENPEESGYYSAIGRVNLHDLGDFNSDGDDSLNQYFDTLPMSIIEVNGNMIRNSRCNLSYRDFLQRTLGIEYSSEVIDCTAYTGKPIDTFLNAILQCGRDGNKTIVDQRIGKDTVAHMLVRRVAVNPIRGTAAIAVAVLAVIRESERQ